MIPDCPVAKSSLTQAPQVSQKLARSKLWPPLDRDDFGLIPSKIMNVILSKNLARDAGGKPGSAFPRPALDIIIIFESVISGAPRQAAGFNLQGHACGRAPAAGFMPQNKNFGFAI